MRQALLAVLLAALLVLAGCTGGVAPGDATDDGQDTGMDGDTGGAMAAGMGTLSFYVSDEKNAIDDFEQLNVTIESVGFQRGGESGNWTERDAGTRTVDLTRLKGDNATLLREYDLPAGNYTKVFVHVGDVEGTLTDGSSPEVKLPSEKLQLNQNFRIEANESIDFVYDITVVERGNSGAYNVKPQAGESGTDQPIDSVDEGEEAEAEDENGDDEDDRAESLDATFVDVPAPGENATVRVTWNGSAVENATVTYDGAEDATDDDGQVSLLVPEDAEEVEVTVEYDDAEVDLEREFDEQPEGEDSQGGY